MNNDPFLSDSDIDLLKRTTLKQFSDDQADTFIRVVQHHRLDPFSRQIYATKRMSHGNITLVTVTGIVGLCALAERTGYYDGCQTYWAGPDGVWKDEWLEEAYPYAAKCIVYHKQHTYPEVGIARWNSYYGRSYNKETRRWEVSEFWDKFPDLMLAKVAKALALRSAFPDHLSGLYAAEEMDGSNGGDEMNDELKIATNRKKEEELLKKAAAQGVKIVESKPAPKATPAQAAAPAPDLSPPKGQGPDPTIPVPAPAQVTHSAPQEESGDLDMEPSQPPQPEPSAEAPAGPPAWAEHVIQGLRNDKYLGRKVGDLSPVELAAIEANWLPKVREVLAKGEKLKQAQQDDAVAFEEAIKHSKLEKPW
jgi:phage recombination protein Bet